MPTIRFLLKFAFICNCCFLLVRLFQIFDKDNHFETLARNAAGLGLVVSPFVNVGVAVWALVLLWRHRVTWKSLPPWIFISNIIIFLLQIFL